MDPGPIDPLVLYGQATHRSSGVWDGQEPVFMKCRRREAVMHVAPVDPRIVPYLRQTGFYGLSQVGFFQLDHHLITAMVERWRPETHTFHLPTGEATITLEDIAVQLGLPVDGRAVTGSTAYDWHALCLELLGAVPEDAKLLKGSRVNMGWLRQQFHVPPPGADEQTLIRYTRAYILQLMGGCLFTDKSGNLVSLMFLPLLRDFQQTGTYSWGAAALAWLYRSLCRAAHGDTMEIAGPVVLIQLWAWDRISVLVPRRLIQREEQGVPFRPLGARWVDSIAKTEVATHVLVVHRYNLDQLEPHQVRFKVHMNYIPLTDDVFKKAIKDNYDAKKEFLKIELTAQQPDTSWRRMEGAEYNLRSVAEQSSSHAAYHHPYSYGIPGRGEIELYGGRADEEAAHAANTQSDYNQRYEPPGSRADPRSLPLLSRHSLAGPSVSYL